jgi:hypothetical protein
VLDRFFTVLPITPSFLVRFQPIKYRIEALIALYTMVRGWSVRFSFWSGQRSGQTWSTLVKLGRIWSKLSRLWEMYPRPHFEGFWAWWTLVGLEMAQSNPGQPSVNFGQTWSTLVRFWEMCPRPRLRLSDVAGLHQIRPA